jgi:hypothetical protein
MSYDMKRVVRIGIIKPTFASCISIMQFKPIAAIAVIVVLVLVIAISGCDGNNRNTGQTQVASYTPTSSQNAPTVSVTATSLGSSNSLSSNYGTATTPASGYKFVKYALYFQNINAKGTDANMGNPYSLRLRDTEGNIYSSDSYTFSLGAQQVNGVTLKGLSVELNTQPGDKYGGMVVFQIPASATPKTLTYDDFTNKITINL